MNSLVGDNCDEMSPDAYATMSGFAVAAALALFGVVSSVILLALLLHKSRVVDKLVMTIFFCGVSLTGLSIYCIATIATWTRSGDMLYVDANSGAKIVRVAIVQNIFTPISVCFAVMALLQVSLVWISVAQAVEHLRLVKATAARYQLILYVTYVVLMVLALVCVFLANYVYLAYLDIVVYALLCPTVLWGYVKIGAVLRDAKTYPSLLRHVRQTAILLPLFYTWFIASTIVFAVMGGVKSATPFNATVNKVSAVVWVSGACVVLVVLRYSALAVSHKLRGSSKSASSTRNARVGGDDGARIHSLALSHQRSPPSTSPPSASSNNTAPASPGP